MRPKEEQRNVWKVWVRHLTPSVSLDLSTCTSQSVCTRAKSQQLHCLSGTLLGPEWEGRPQRGVERFNLKSVQLATEHSKCMCVCVREILTTSLNQKFNSTSVLRFFKHNSAGLQIMQHKLCSQLKKFTSLLPKETWCIPTNHLHPPRRRDPVWRRPELWWNR